MRLTAVAILFLSLSISMVPAIRAADEAKGNPVVVVETSLGSFEVELFQDKAPITVKNFLDYTKEKFFDGTVFHRVWDGFMIQGGGFTPDLKQKKTKDAIKNEANNGLKNEVGTLAMARMQDPHSASAEFFINVANNVTLDHTGKNPAGWGYCVFGKVVSGMDVVNKIKTTPVHDSKPGEIEGQKVDLEKVPKTTVEIKSIKVK